MKKETKVAIGAGLILASAYYLTHDDGINLKAKMDVSNKMIGFVLLAGGVFAIYKGTKSN